MANEKRLIDANALLRKKYEIYEPEDPEQWGSRPYTHKVVSVEDVKNAPTVDAVEVVHGRWNLIEDCWAIYQCSCCKEEFVTEDGEEVEELWNYCPNCGAKMDGDGNGQYL